MIQAWRSIAAAVAALLPFSCPLHKPTAEVAVPDAEQADAPAPESSSAEVADSAPPAAPAHAGPEVPRKKAGARCAAGEAAILLAPGEEGCVIECKSNAGCPAGWTCEGEGVLSNGGKPGGDIRFCRATSHGAAPVIAPDAGKASPPVDASTPPPPAPRKLNVKQSATGGCEAGYKICGAMCRLACSKDSDCGALPSVSCQDGFCLAPGSKPCPK